MAKAKDIKATAGTTEDQKFADALAKEAAAAAADSDFLDDSAGQGYEDVRSKTPMLKILIATSPQVNEADDEHIPGAKPGHFYNTVTKRVYKELNCNILLAKKAWTLWVPQDQGGGFKGRVAPESIRTNGDFFKGGMYTEEGYEVHDTFEVYVLLKGEEKDGPVLFSFTKGHIPHANRWLQANRTVRTPKGNVPPLWGSYWKIWTSLNKKNIQGVGNTQWYHIGNDEAKTTNCEWVRFISKTENLEFVQPNLKFLESAAKFQMRGSGAPRMLTDGGSEAGADGEDIPF